MEQNEASILILDDDQDIQVAAKVVLSEIFKKVYTCSDPSEIERLLQENRFDIILLDMNFSLGYTSGKEGMRCLEIILSQVPNQAVVMMTAYGSIKLAVEAMKKGAVDFVVKPWLNEKLKATLMAVYKKVRTAEGRTPELDMPLVNFIYKSAGMKAVWEMAHKLAPTDAAVLITGESGTGKEELAYFIHGISKRANAPFIKIDLGAINPGLFESELFGHKKGSFTDAREDKIGKVLDADSGTLFFDEIANLPLFLQSKLLTLLQTKSFSPIGTNLVTKVDFRLICATNMNLRMLVNENKFREDLLFRINTLEITIPPLRERLEDMEDLANHFFNLYKQKHGKPDLEMDSTVIQYLKSKNWPGNVREFQHAIERAIILSDHRIIRKEDFFEEQINITDESLHHEEVERQAIMKALKKHGGNMQRTARELGFARSTLYRKVQRYGL